MKRLIEKKLALWKDSLNRKPLIIRGARQVGKTYTVKKFGTNSFSSFVTIDFERDQQVHAIFENDLHPQKIIQELEIYTGKRIIPGKTLLFFDEIQSCSRALMMLRYFYEELPDLHVIAAGSLLEFAINTTSFPVGRVSLEWMRPMNFREFLLANHKEILHDHIPSVYDTKSISDTLHQGLLHELRSYCIVGGMPEAVKRYSETNSFKTVNQVHEDITYAYIESLSKYGNKSHIDSLEHILKVTPSKVGTQIKYSKLDPERRIEITKSSLHILEKALLLHKIKSVGLSGLPLAANASSKIFKLLFLDIGLMQSICGFNPLEILHTKDITSIYQGSVAEQFIGQEILASGGSENNQLFYWNRMKKSSSAEVDYVIARKGKIIPIEVKSGAGGRMRSLHQLFLDYPTIEKGLLLSSENHKNPILDKLVFRPLYASFDNP